jgi:hypothetical protein
LVPPTPSPTPKKSILHSTPSTRRRNRASVKFAEEPIYHEQSYCDSQETFTEEFEAPKHPPPPPKPSLLKRLTSRMRHFRWRTIRSGSHSKSISRPYPLGVSSNTGRSRALVRTRVTQSKWRDVFGCVML